MAGFSEKSVGEVAGEDQFQVAGGRINQIKATAIKLGHAERNVKADGQGYLERGSGSQSLGQIALSHQLLLGQFTFGAVLPDSLDFGHLPVSRKQRVGRPLFPADLTIGQWHTLFVAHHWAGWPQGCELCDDPGALRRRQ